MELVPARRTASWLLAWGVAACLAAAATAAVGAAAAAAADAGKTEQRQKPIVSGWARPKPEAATDRVLVRFKSTPQAAARAAAQAATPVVPGLQLTRYAGKHHRRAVPRGSSGPAVAAVGGSGGGTAGVPADATMVFTVTDGASVGEKLKLLKAHPDVAAAEPDYKMRLFRSPNDPLFPPDGRGPGMWFLQHISAPGAWETTVGSSSVTVCVIDSGLRSTHKDLAANVAGGWNRALKPDGTQPVYGTAEYDNFADTDGHGSHVSGSIGAVGDNGVGIVGVSWRVSLYACKALSPPDADGNAYMFESAVLDCYALCGSVGAKVVSASYGGYGFSSLARDAINELGLGGTVVVAAAGNEANDNDANPAYPASYVTSSRNVISVAAAMPSDSLASFSNWGRKSAHLAAPGVSILSTVPWTTSSYDYNSGTSMATPLTAGAVALLFAAKPSATVAEIKNALLRGVDPIPALEGRLASGGRLNVQRALAVLLGDPLPPTPVRTYTYTQEPGTLYSFSLSWAQFALTNSSSCLAECAGLGVWYACRAWRVGILRSLQGARCTQWHCINTIARASSHLLEYLHICQGPRPACRCQDLEWCYYAVSFSYVKTISKWDGRQWAPAYWGMCLHVDMSAAILNTVSTSMANAAYKSPLPESLLPWQPALPPPPAPPPPLPHASGSLSVPTVIPSVPYSSATIDDTSYALFKPPVTCFSKVSLATVFRFYANASVAGTLGASSCDYTTGDPLLIVYSSAKPNGPFKCVGGNDDGSCTGASAFAFDYNITLKPNTYYWFVVAPHSVATAAEALSSAAQITTAAQAVSLASKVPAAATPLPTFSPSA
ncbi:hypothetical protein ABPG75_012506 [Micractinium tetrahymenae]